MLDRIGKTMKMYPEIWHQSEHLPPPSKKTMKPRAGVWHHCAHLSLFLIKTIKGIEQVCQLSKNTITAHRETKPLENLQNDHFGKTRREDIFYRSRLPWSLCI
jgi:hypothetical protein